MPAAKPQLVPTRRASNAMVPMLSSVVASWNARLPAADRWISTTLSISARSNPSGIGMPWFVNCPTSSSSCTSGSIAFIVKVPGV